MNISFACACNDIKTFNENLGSSEMFLKSDHVVINNSTNVQKAYNLAAKSLTGDIICFVHQDVYLPKKFEANLRRSLEEINDVDWGVLGVAGRLGQKWLGHLLDRGKQWGDPAGLPAQVRTLDELMLIVKANTFKFDEDMPNYHMFGADICLQALEAGKKVMAIRAYCHHNSCQDKQLPAEFSEAARYICYKWAHRLPIETTCATIRANTW